MKGCYESKLENSIYDGTFQQNAMHGEGKLTIKNVLEYEGGFMRGKFHGQGVLKNIEKSFKYDGNFENGKK